MIVYLLSSIQGVGLAIMLNTATSLISDFIGKDADSSAFVYGAYSFFDKMANGVIIFIITSYFNHDEVALRWIIGTTPIICSVLAFVLTYGWESNSSLLSQTPRNSEKVPSK